MNRLLSNTSVKISLTLMLAIFALLIIIIAFLGYQSGKQGSQSLASLNQTAVEEMLPLSFIQREIVYTQLFYEKFLAETNDGRHGEAQEFLSQAQDSLRAAQADFAKFESSPSHDVPVAVVDEVMRSFNALVEQGLLPVEQAMQSGSDVENEAMETIAGYDIQFRAASTVYIDQAAEYSRQTVTDYYQQVSLMGYIQLIVLLSAALLVIFVRFVLAGAIVKPLNEALIHFERIAKHDFSSHISDRGRNEIGKLFSAMQGMQIGLSKTASEVGDSCSSIYIGAREIASGNADLSSRTEQQAASLQETASSMEES